MATTYVRAAGGHVAERVQTEPGSPEETHLEELVADPGSGWRREDSAGEEGRVRGPAPSSAAPPQSASKATWAAWAVGEGLVDADQADDLTKQQLIDLADELAASKEDD